jgi:hypothetical protein
MGQMTEVVGVIVENEENGESEEKKAVKENLDVGAKGANVAVKVNQALKVNKDVGAKKESVDVGAKKENKAVRENVENTVPQDLQDRQDLPTNNAVYAILS